MGFTRAKKFFFILSYNFGKNLKNFSKGEVHKEKINYPPKKMAKKEDKIPVDKIVITFLLTFYCKTVLTALVGYFLSKGIDNNVDNILTKVHINAVVPSLYLFQLWIIAQAFYQLHYYQLVGSIIFSGFWLLMQGYYFETGFFNGPQILIKFLFRGINYFVVLFEFGYLIYQYNNLKRVLIWKNSERIGANVNTKNKLILKEKLKTILKIYFSMIFISLIQLTISLELKLSLKKPILSSILNGLVVFLYFMFVKYETKVILIAAVLFNAYIIAYVIQYKIVKYDSVVLFSGFEYYLWRGCEMGMLVLILYYGLCNLFECFYGVRENVVA